MKNASEISKVLYCFSSPTRLLITCMLLNGEKNVTEILEEIGTTKGNISQHLRLLTDNKILGNRRQGNKVYYFIEDKRVKKLVEDLKRLYCPDFKF